MCITRSSAAGSALVVDDDPGLLAFLSDALPADRVSVLAAASAEDALGMLRDARPDLAVVDVGLPGMTGLDLVEALRRGGPDDAWDAGMPILVVSGRADAHAPVRALDRGADDFLVKPFHYPELLARVGALLRRSRGMAAGGAARVGPVVIDRRARLVTAHGQPVTLSVKEYALLAALVREPTRVHTKEELLRDVWGYVGRARTRTVDSHASRLRCKLAQAGADGFVANVWGVGYRLRADG